MAHSLGGVRPDYWGANPTQSPCLGDLQAAAGRLLYLASNEERAVKGAGTPPPRGWVFD